jgi:hypothetical protein
MLFSLNKSGVYYLLFYNVIVLKKLLGIAPKLESDGSYSPSWLALKL